MWNLCAISVPNCQGYNRGGTTDYYLELLKNHITAAMDARDHYRACITRAKIAEADSIEQESDNVSYAHATFDFARQATIPHHARQVGPLYFRVPRRVQIFGVANEGLPKQVNYLVDTNETIGNPTLSLVCYITTWKTKPRKQTSLVCMQIIAVAKTKTRVS